MENHGAIIIDEKDPQQDWRFLLKFTKLWETQVPYKGEKKVDVSVLINPIQY